MAWTKITRRKYRRDGLRCASDLTDEEWARGYAGDKLRKALKGKGEWTIEIVKRSDAAKAFVLLPRRLVVERTFAWIGRCRRLVKDFEATTESAVAWVLVAHIRRLVRRLAIL